MRKHSPLLVGLVLALFTALAAETSALAGSDVDILKNLHTVSTIASTIPANQDVNPYGVAKVRRTIGNLTEGHILVSNFNNSSNLQGTGTTIVDVAPDGAVSLFAQINPSTLPGPCPGGVGLTTALVVLRSGWVIVGSLPTSDGTAATAQAGCLIVLNSMGTPVETFFGTLVNGPWDMTAFDGGDWAALFYTNVLNGTVRAGGAVVNQGTVVRMNVLVSDTSMPWVESMTVIGSGFSERTDPVALVVGPTGVGLSVSDEDDRFGQWGENEPLLYIADTQNNRVVAIPDALNRRDSAGSGKTISSGCDLSGPLGLTVAQGGHILTVNGGNGYIVEITPSGNQIAETLLDNVGTPPGNGALFGLVYEPGRGVIFVDDNSDTLNLLH